jgi:NTP pyrophosphatase (non-canonical NTP hydrolase)
MRRVEIPLATENYPMSDNTNQMILRPNGSLTVKDLQAAVDRWIDTYGVRYFSEMTNLAVLMEEIGELARIISRTYGEQSFKEKDRPTDLANELADVLFVLVCIANQTGVDLEAAMSRNLQKKTARDHRRHRDNPKLTS